MPKTEMSGRALVKAAIKSLGGKVKREDTWLGRNWYLEMPGEKPHHLGAARTCRKLLPCDLKRACPLLERWLDGAGKEKRGVRLEFTGRGWEVRLYEADRADYTRGVGVGSSAPEAICRALVAAAK